MRRLRTISLLIAFALLAVPSSALAHNPGGTGWYGPTTDKVYRNNRQYYNLGCASQRNLAAQVAEPADLVQPRSEAPVLASRRNTVTEHYRKGEPTATQAVDADKGKISDVGK